MAANRWQHDIQPRAIGVQPNEQVHQCEQEQLPREALSNLWLELDLDELAMDMRLDGAVILLQRR